MMHRALAVAAMVAVWWWAVSAGVLYGPTLAIPTGIALGAFRLHSLLASWRVYRVCVYALLILVIALHPAFWGGAAYAHVLRDTLFGPLCTVALFGIGVQLGAVINRALVESLARKRMAAIEAEFAPLLDRIAWSSARLA